MTGEWSRNNSAWGTSTNVPFNISLLCQTHPPLSLSLTNIQSFLHLPFFFLIFNSTPTHTPHRHSFLRHSASFLIHPLPSCRLRHSPPPLRPPLPAPLFVPLLISSPLSPVAYYPSVSLIPHSSLPFSFLFFSTIYHPPLFYSLLSIPPLPLGTEATEMCRGGFDHGSVNHNWGWRVAGWDPCTGKPWLACLLSALRLPRLPFSSLLFWVCVYVCLCESERKCMCIASHTNG